MAEDRKAFPLRLSTPLFEEIKRWASDEMRSVNGQIEYLLRHAVAQRRNASKAGPEVPADSPSPDEAGD